MKILNYWGWAVGVGLLSMSCADVDGASTNETDAVAEETLVDAPVAEATAIKGVVGTYFDLKYLAKSELKVKDFKHLVSGDPSRSRFYQREFDRQTVELDNSLLNNLRATKYSYSLDYDSIRLSSDGTQAVVMLREGSDINYALNPAITSMVRNTKHSVRLSMVGSAWRIQDDQYSDTLSEYINASGFSVDRLLQENRSPRHIDRAIGDDGAPAASGAVRSAASKVGQVLSEAAYTNWAYNRTAALNYAYAWNTHLRNPLYADYSSVGGDCTNYTSQCLIAGGAPNDNITPYTWYYYGPNPPNRTTSWTSVQPFYDYLVNNWTPWGLWGYPTNFAGVAEADLIQYKWKAGAAWAHTMIITWIWRDSAGGNSSIYVSGHTNDEYNVPLAGQLYNAIRYLKVGGYFS